MLMTFFVVMTGKPQWAASAELLNFVLDKPGRWTADTLRPTWGKRASDFSHLNLDTVLYGQVNHALRFGIGSQPLRDLLARTAEKLDAVNAARIGLRRDITESAKRKAREMMPELPARVLDRIGHTLSVVIPDDVLDRGPTDEHARARVRRLVSQVIEGALARLNRARGG